MTVKFNISTQKDLDTLTQTFGDYRLVTTSFFKDVIKKGEDGKLYIQYTDEKEVLPVGGAVLVTEK